MSQQLDTAVSSAAEVVREYAKRVGHEEAFRRGLAAFFLALPDGVARELLARKQPHHNWQTAFAAELSAGLSADVPAAF